MVGHRFCEQLVDAGGLDRFEITVFGEECRPAYDRVGLSQFFSGRSAEELSLTSESWYREQGITLHVDRTIASIDPATRIVVDDRGDRIEYDELVLATGSAPFVPPLPGVTLPGVFVYRTIEDLVAIQEWAGHSKRAAVIGGGLLGLEAAKAARDMGLETHVLEFNDRLMARQIDAAAGAVLRREIEKLSVQVRLGARTDALVGEDAVEGVRFADGALLAVDMVIVSAGIRPRDELARAAGITVGERGGIAVDDRLTTSDPHVHAIGECALHRDFVYGLVAPGYDMARTLATRLCGDAEAGFREGDLSTKLKLLGIDVASFGDPFAADADPSARSVVFEDAAAGVYQKLVLDADGTRLLGGILLGDTAPYALLHSAMREQTPVPERPHEWLFGSASSGVAGATALPDEAQICSCNDVTKSELLCAVADGATTLGELKACTRVGTGCGGCIPSVTQVLEAELERGGVEVNRSLCPHFPYTREELFWIVKLGRIESFDALLDSHGSGEGCEVCRPAVASILAATWNDLVFKHATIQDTNDRFLANIQRGGTYSVIPRVPGGEITPEKLIVLGEVAKKYDLYCKITGGQRVDLLGARVEQLPTIWEELVAAGFESGHAYGKAMRTVKSCVGSTWCRFGVQDSTAFAIRIEERYRGIRAPHKFKSAVSGCIRECAEAQNKDFGIIATENGWNVYLCGNGGANPRHGDLVATDLPDDEVIALIDRFLMFYIQTAKPLQRTARWLEELAGGIEYLKSVIVDDALGVGDQLEQDMQQLVDRYQCEWRAVVEDETLRARFRHFAATDPSDASGAHGSSASFLRERNQKRPIDWPDASQPAASIDVPSEESWTWQQLAHIDDFPLDGGAAVSYGGVQLAIYRFARRGSWYATQAMCPHRKDNVLARGLLGDQEGEPKVACPMHKKTFSLESGKGLSDPNYSVQTFPVEVRGDEVWVRLPPANALETELACSRHAE